MQATGGIDARPWRQHTELDARARVMRAAPASASASSVVSAATLAAATASTGSPVAAVSSCKNTSSASRSSSASCSEQPQQQPRPTRTLLSRLFRSKNKSDSPRCENSNHDGDEGDEYGGARGSRRPHAGVHSPILATSMSALHLRDQRPHHHGSLGDQQLDSSFYYNKQQHHQQQQEQEQEEQPNNCEDLRRRESAPAQVKNFYHQQQQVRSGGGLYPTAVERFPARKILIQGYLTKLSAHKYWHAKPSYFVLEESATVVASMATLRVTLKQFRKQEDAQVQLTSDLVLSEIALSADDVVADISNRHTKHGFELLVADMQAAASQAQADTTTTAASLWSAVAALTTSASLASSSSSSALRHQASVVRSIRLAAPDALALESWIAAIGTAIAKLIFQTRAQQQVTAQQQAAGLASRAPAAKYTTSAKVAPIVSDCPDDDGDDELLQEEIRQAERQQQQQNDDDDDEEKPWRPHGYRAVSQSEPEQHVEIGDDATSCADIELGPRGNKPLRRCPSCYQWMPFDCDDEEQTSCCSCCESEDGYDNNSRSNHNSNNNNSSLDGDNQSDDSSEDHVRSHDAFVSPGVSSSSATSFTPSNSPDYSSAVLNQETNSSSSSNNRHHAFSSFIVSPNPPAQIIGAGSSSTSLFSPSVALYPSKTVPSEHDLESELKSSSTSLSQASSGATAFLRSRFSRGSASHHQYAYQRPPPMHSFTANGQVFTLDTRYKLVKSIGTGAYGAVISVKDSVADTSVAVKKITNIFEDLVDAKRILREVRLLGHFQHKNITRLLDLSPPVSKTQFEDMYIITELMETDLHQVIYSMQPMSDDHVKYFLYQMLCALHHIHSAGVIHRDMKPSNVLLNSNCDLKICDFGLARGGVSTSQHQQQQSSTNSSKSRNNREELTEYVVTRWYRAPEIMLNCLQYTEAIDVWAVGCIFAEMLLREPLFPGNDYIHQLKLIIKFLGTPKQEDIEFVKNVKALRFLTKLAIFKPRKWRDVFAAEDDVNPLAVDLLSKMLLFNPEKRISVDEALQHPYLATFYDPADITNAPESDFSFDLPDDKLSKEALIDLLCEDIAHFHPMVPPLPSTTASSSATAAHSSSSRFFGMGMTASAS
ncbi:hypothetical protein Gpo141_00007699 [Globisporangium polare]